MTEFRVDLTNPPQGVYFPGMMVTGAVVCTTNEPKDYKQIIVKLVGMARVHWSESSGSGNNTRHHSYTSYEEYLSCAVVLWDKATNAQGGNFPTGSYRFNFSLQLAGPNLPASYTGTVGAITYTLEARIAKSALKLDKKATAQLNVGSVIKVDHPELAQPLSKEVRKTLCCLCCASGPIVMTARIPRTGFCIGHDSIPIEISVENGSSRVIQNVQVALIKSVVYTAQGRHRYDKIAVVRIDTRSVAPHETAVIQSEPLVIPANIPPTLRNCHILTVNYYVMVTGAISWSIYPSIEFPVVIGNVPLQGQSGAENFQSQPAAPNYYNPPPTDPYPPPLASDNAWGLPPSYTPAETSNQMPIGFVDPIKKM